MVWDAVKNHGIMKPGGLGPELFLVDFLCSLGLGRNSGGCTIYFFTLVTASDGCYLSIYHLLHFDVFRYF